MGEEIGQGLLASIILIATSLSLQRLTSAETGRFLQAFFYETIALGNRSLADYLHGYNGLKPFTLAFLPPGQPRSSPTSSHMPPIATMRVTVLTADLYQVVVDSLMRRCQASAQFQLGPHTLEVQQVLFSGERHPLADRTSYENLFTAPPDPGFTLGFLTPTSFRTGLGNLPLPLPVSVYRSLWQKWEHFAPAHLHIEDTILPTVERHLFPAHYTLRTEVLVQDGATQQVGFVGTCRFEIIGKITPTEHQAIAALSRFAAYAGVGMKTTMGMGQTRVLDRSNARKSTLRPQTEREGSPQANGPHTRPPTH